jgi:valyl-tRNA synthetase
MPDQSPSAGLTATSHAPPTTAAAEQPSVASTIQVPDRPSLEGLEERWSRRWDEWQIYRFPQAVPSPVYSIDTPPPTVSGSLHIGHIFSYTHPDIVARFQRMSGRTVFYPIGWDDNGLATERRVENYYGVRCDPSLPYDASFAPPSERPERPIAISRPNFIELCELLTHTDEVAFEELFRRLGLSVDWSTKYTTISALARRTSQLAFLHLVENDDAYRQEAPTMWDVDFQCSVAQAELEDREVAAAFHRVRFQSAAAGDPVEIDTTRPELIPSCVALVVNPDDPRHRHLVGSSAVTPLFGVEVPILAHKLADPGKGTGIAMVCTFGDLTDVTWWRELALPTRTLIGRDGRFGSAPFGTPGWESRDLGKARQAFSQLEGLTTNKARERVVGLLRESGDLVGEPRPIRHFVNFYEKGERPLEIVSSRQWYVRTMRHRDDLIALGRQINWHPAFMRSRYEAWIEGLTGDWNISRQRYYGVPFPVWYPIAADGSIEHDHPILAEAPSLPVDPSSSAPPGYRENQRGVPRGFIADPDVMDTWATSSLTPQIAGHWAESGKPFENVFPMDLRPQAHDIIRTWLFSTVVRSNFEHHSIPWKNVAISGFILDPERKKLSKSKGGAVVPSEFLDAHGTDGVRYWAGSARLGSDAVLDEQQMQIGRRLAIKILNASKFILSRRADFGEVSLPSRAEISHPLDLAMLAQLAQVVDEATNALASYEHARALERTERLFWTFCDDYLELVKTRAYSDGPGARSARAALGLSLDVLLRLFAPFLTYCTEEAWSWSHPGSIHAADWPSARSLRSGVDGNEGDGAILDDAGQVLSAVRRAKSDAKTSMRTPVGRVVVAADAATLRRIGLAADDLKATGVIETLDLQPADRPLQVAVTLAGVVER